MTDKQLREKLLKSMLGIVIQRLISETGSVHGYQIIKVVRERYGVYFSPSTVYPYLARLEKQGLITSDWIMCRSNRPIKSYTLTAKGRADLQAGEVELKVIALPLCSVVSKTAGVEE